MCSSSPPRGEEAWDNGNRCGGQQLKYSHCTPTHFFFTPIFHSDLDSIDRIELIDIFIKYSKKKGKRETKVFTLSLINPAYSWEKFHFS